MTVNRNVDGQWLDDVARAQRVTAVDSNGDPGIDHVSTVGEIEETVDVDAVGVLASRMADLVALLGNVVLELKITNLHLTHLSDMYYTAYDVDDPE